VAALFCGQNFFSGLLIDHILADISEKSIRNRSVEANIKICVSKYPDFRMIKNCGFHRFFG